MPHISAQKTSIILFQLHVMVLSVTTQQTRKFPLLDTIEFVLDPQKTKISYKIGNGKNYFNFKWIQK